MKNILLTIFALLLSNFYFAQTYSLTAAISGTTISTCTGTFVDNGGSGANYSANQNTTITFCPATPGDVIKVTFTTLDLRAAGGGGCQDILDVYQGDATYAAPLITAGTPDDRLCGTITGTNLPVFYSTGTNGCITFNFISDGSQQNAGWVATVSCVTPCKNPTAALINTSILNLCGPTSNSPGSLNVGFDASNSTLGAYGPGGSTVTLTSYQWTFGDGTTSTTSSATTSHTYPSAPGVYVMKLSVTDNNTDVSATGCSSTNSVTKIIRVLPAPSFTGTTVSPQNLGCGSNATLTAVAKSQTETQNIPAVSGVTVALPDGSGSSFISNADFSGLFPSGATITSGCYPTLYFNLEHSYAPDLTIDLIAPSGETVRVFNRHGAGGMFGPLYMFGTCVNGADNGVPGCGATYSVANAGGQSWTNYGAAAITTTTTASCAGYTGTCQGGTTANPYYKPTLYTSTNAFTALNGATMNGTWQLKITDNQALDDGFLFSWGLVFPSSCYTPLESVTPDLTTLVWTNGGAGPAVPGAQTTTTASVIDPGPDACPTPGTCTGNQLTNTITFGPFNTPGTYPYLYTATDEFGCSYTRTVNVAVSCSCPSLTAISYAGPFCENTAGTITPTVTGTGAISSGSYSSTPAGLSISAVTGIITPSLSTANTYTVTYLVAASGTCSAISVNTVVTINATPTITVNSPTVCSGTSTVLTASGGTTYSWTPGTSLSAITGATVSADPTVTIVYTVTGTTNGCSSSNTSTVTVNATPTISVNSETICSGTSTVLTASGGTTYSWTPSTSLNATTGATVSANPTTTIVYTVTGTTSGCSSSNTSTVTVNTTPTITVNSPTICSGTSTVLTASGGTTYSWTPGTSLSATTGATVTANPTTTIVYTVTGTTAGCSSSNTSTVTVNVTPTITASSSQSVCSGLTVSAINFTVTPGASSVNWSNTNTATGIAASGSGTTIAGYTAPNVVSSTTGVITATATNNGCTATVSNTVTINPLPTATVTPLSQTITCSASSVTLTGSATPSTCTPVWTGGVSSGANSYTATASSANIYTLTVTNPATSCVASATTQVFASAGFPIVTVSNTNSLSCVTSTAQVIASTTTTPVSYAWTGPGITSGASTATANVNAGGDYTVVVTNTASACSATLSINVPASTTTITPVLTVTAPGSITCTNPTLTINATPSTGVTYTWTGAGLTSSANAQNATINAGGNYVLSVTNTTNGCVGSASVTVSTNNSAPTVTVNPSTFTVTCTTPTVQLTASSTASNITYSWTANGGSLNSTTVANPIATGAGTYDILVTNTITGCQSSTTATVVADNAIPSITVSANSLTITCTNTTVTSAITSTNSTLSYVWNPTPQTGGANPVFDALGSYTADITASNGCSVTTIIDVDVDNVAPTITITPTQTLTCASPTGVISTTVNPTSGITYTWTGTGVTGQSSTSVTINQAGDYTVAITNSANGCTNTASSHVDADANVPVASISATSTNTLITCLAPSVTLSVSATPAGTYSYTWSGGSNTSIQNATVSGIYTATVLNTVSGCTTTAQYTVTDNIVPPSVSVTNYTIPCGVPSATIEATATNVSYTWTTSGTGSILSGSNTAIPTIGSAGQYVVTVVDNTTGCTNSGTVNVTQNTIAATISANPISGTAPLSVDFSNTNVGGTNYSWNFGDIINNTSTSSAPSHTYNTVGTYVVTFTVTDASGLCSATATLSIEVFENSVLIIPNVFTPNGDNSNDVFKIQSNGINTLNCEIINRWGQKMYTITSPSDSWDGNANGAGPAPDGTYFFILKATGYDGKEYEEKGFINLFR